MKKALRIHGDHYLNMNHIVEWWFDKDSLHIATVLTDGDPFVIVVDSSEDRHGHITNKVTVSELHRIKREIAEYYM